MKTNICYRPCFNESISISLGLTRLCSTVGIILIKRKFSAVILQYPVSSSILYYAWSSWIFVFGNCIWNNKKSKVASKVAQGINF